MVCIKCFQDTKIAYTSDDNVQYKSKNKEQRTKMQMDALLPLLEEEKEKAEKRKNTSFCTNGIIWQLALHNQDKNW